MTVSLLNIKPLEGMIERARLLYSMFPSSVVARTIPGRMIASLIIESLINEVRKLKVLVHTLPSVPKEPGVVMISHLNVGENIEGINTGSSGRKYQITEQIGLGRVGIIYKAIDLETKKEVAVKALQPGEQKIHDVRRFLREAEALAALNHPNILCVEDVGQDITRPFFVMEYLSGGTLDDLIKQYHKQELDLQVMLHYFADICEGLQRLHNSPKRIVHRDIKPQNILISSETRNDDPKRYLLKIADLGVSHFDKVSERLTQNRQTF